MIRTLRLTACFAGVALAAGCAAPDPGAQRRSYEVSLNGWAAKEQAPPAPVVDESLPADEAAPVEEVAPAEGEEVMLEPALPTTVVADVQLSILVTNNGGDLDQLTVDISHADAAGLEKATYRRTLDVGQIVRGLTSDVTVVLEGVELGARAGEGAAYPDSFAVTVRQDVPAGERGEYPELSGAGN